VDENLELIAKLQDEIQELKDQAVVLNLRIDNLLIYSKMVKEESFEKGRCKKDKK
jgi:hypothetical protein